MLEELKKIDEWWETGRIPDELTPLKKRVLFEEIVELIDDRRIIAVIGPRRTGKTTLMFQLMDYLIKEKRIDAKHILFFSGDDISLKEIKNLIGEAVKTYFEDFLKQDYRGKKAYIFIDEVHKIGNWQLWLKKFYDLRYNIKFFISGSSAAKIKKEQKESLAGRILEFKLFPLSFREFLLFNNYLDLPKLKIEELLNEKRLKLLKEELGFKKELVLRKFFDEYLLVGGFPEWFEVKNIKKWQERLREDVIKRVIYDDIATLYKVKNVYKLELLMYLLSNLQSQAYSYNSIANTLKIDNETAQLYVEYLKESFLIFELRNYAASLEKELRKNYKYVIVDSGLRNVFAKIEDLSRINEKEIGFMVEGAVQQHLCWFKKEPENIFYWRDKFEVDIVIRINQKIIPIEVKYQSKIEKEDLKGLFEFMERFRINFGFVITKSSFEFRSFGNKKIIFIPTWLFLSVYQDYG